MYHNFGKLTTGELSGAETACQLLVALHEAHGVLDHDLYIGVSTALADIHSNQEDRAAAEARGRITAAARHASEIPS
jgi:hypothetical protein